MRYLQQDNLGLLSRNMDHVREWAPHISIQQLYGEVSMQATLLSLKELFGWICIVGTLFLLSLCLPDMDEIVGGGPPGVCVGRKAGLSSGCVLLGGGVGWFHIFFVVIMHVKII